MSEEKEGLLAPYRVLDLTDEKGYLCGRILGDLGADVIKIEPPGGDRHRGIGPFYRDIPHPEKSLYWFALNANKRGITLNVQTEDGRDIFRRLVERADFVIESFPPGYMEKLCLGYSELSQINPRIIMTSITPFGQSGPYRDFEGSDIVSSAMGGLMFMGGDPDRPPLVLSFPQAYFHAGAEAAVGSLMALWTRGATGKGQFVDVSIQESIPVNVINAVRWWDLAKIVATRVGHHFFRADAEGIKPFQIHWECKDGFVSMLMMSGRTGQRSMNPLINWMESDGMAGPLKGLDWGDVEFLSLPRDQLDRLIGTFMAFFKKFTKAELFSEAVKRNIQLYPVWTIKEAMENPQLLARQFWEEVEHPALSTTIMYPGSFVKSPKVTAKVRRCAPLIGEHNLEIYCQELGLSQKQVVVLKNSQVI